MQVVVFKSDEGFSSSFKDVLLAKQTQQFLIIIKLVTVSARVRKIQNM
jgi:hypothetical protein